MSAETEVVVTMQQVRKAKMCSRGTRQFFDRYNLDWNTFLQSGISSSVILATGDAMGAKVVEVARGRE